MRRSERESELANEQTKDARNSALWHTTHIHTHQKGFDAMIFMLDKR